MIGLNDSTEQSNGACGPISLSHLYFPPKPGFHLLFDMQKWRENNLLSSDLVIFIHSLNVYIKIRKKNNAGKEISEIVVATGECM